MKFRLIKSNDYYQYTSFKRYIVQQRRFFGWRDVFRLSIDCYATGCLSAGSNDEKDAKAKAIFNEFVQGNGAFLLAEVKA